MSEAASVTTFMIGSRLPWPDDLPAPAESGPLDSAVVHESGSKRGCSIRKISPLGATLRGAVRGKPGDALSVELANGQRPAATIVWVKGDEAGVSFNQPIDMIALINRTLINQPAERRAMPRVELRCAAWVKSGQDFAPATVRNISAGGLQLEGDSIPRVGTYVSLFIEGLNVPPGEIVWRQKNLGGIALLDDLNWSSIMPWIRDLSRKEPL
jgi:hypothetical protein